MKNKLTWAILLSMIIGAAIGYFFPSVAIHLKIVSKIFIRLIKCIIGPLIFATIVAGIAGHGDLKQVGRMGLRAFIYFEVVTLLALVIGLFAINITQAGKGIVLSPSKHDETLVLKKQTLEEVLIHVFPENIAKSVADGEVLQIVLFSLLFGIALAMVAPKHKDVFLQFTDSLSEIMFKFTTIIMYFAPIGVGAAMAYTVGHMGIGVLLNLIALLFTLYGALLFFVIVVLVPIAIYHKISIPRFSKKIAEPVGIAFATTSSEAALPKLMEVLESCGIPRKIVAFVLPMGYSFNLDGTTLYLSLASVFVAQAAGIDMTWQQQTLMALTLMLTSKGVAGVPRASLVILMGTAASFDLPVEPIFLILGIDELMDMARTSVNVIGNSLATVVIAKWEGEELKI